MASEFVNSLWCIAETANASFYGPYSMCTTSEWFVIHGCISFYLNQAVLLTIMVLMCIKIK